MDGDHAVDSPGFAADEVQLEGVTLPQFAGVVAALAEEMPLDVILAREAIELAAWPKAASAWRIAIAKAPDLQLRYVEKVREAEDCLARSVHPLDDDAAAWAGLLGALAVGGASEKLAALGLRMSDVGRIGRAWSDKARRDPAVERSLADAAGRCTAPAQVACGPTSFRGFPWSPNGSWVAVSARATSAPEEAASTPRLRRRVDGVLPVTRDVDLFAALEVALDLDPDRRSILLGLTGLTATEYDTVSEGWERRFARSAEVRAAFISRSVDHRAALRRLLHGAVPVMVDADEAGRTATS